MISHPFSRKILSTLESRTSGWSFLQIWITALASFFAAVATFFAAAFSFFAFFAYTATRTHPCRSHARNARRVLLISVLRTSGRTFNVLTSAAAGSGGSGYLLPIQPTGDRAELTTPQRKQQQQL